MVADLDAALAELLGERRTGSLVDDAIAAATEARRREMMAPRLGGAAVAYLRRTVNPRTGRPWSLRDIARATGIPKDTVERWSEG